MHRHLRQRLAISKENEICFSIFCKVDGYLCKVSIVRFDDFTGLNLSIFSLCLRDEEN